MSLHTFVGHDDTEVLFPRNKIGTSAHFVRASDQADVAMIKVDMPDALDTVHLAPQDYSLKLGEPISVLGYPAISPTRKVSTRGHELIGPIDTPGIIPEPTLTNGIISKLNSADVTQVTPDPNVQQFQPLGDYFQLTDLATGGGNSGGPIFNSEGQVIGIFTGESILNGTRITLGIPIRYGWEIYGRNPFIAKQ
jgi:serine protease Do